MLFILMLLNGKEVSIIVLLIFLKVLILKSPKKPATFFFFKGMRLLLPTPPSSAGQLKHPHQRAELQEAAWGPPQHPQHGLWSGPAQ